MSRRIRLLVEGLATTDGRFIDIGATRWEEGKRYPVSPPWGSPNNDMAGEVWNLRRERDSSITAETDVEAPAVLSGTLKNIETAPGLYGVTRFTTGDFIGATQMEVAPGRPSEASWPWKRYPIDWDGPLSAREITLARLDRHEPQEAEGGYIECSCGWPPRDWFMTNPDPICPNYNEHILDVLEGQQR